jgi:hypothetical protein
MGIQTADYRDGGNHRFKTAKEREGMTAHYNVFSDAASTNGNSFCYVQKARSKRSSAKLGPHQIPA